MADATTLERCPLFSPLPSRVMVSLAPRFHDITVAAGQVLCRAGDPADAFWVVHTGQLQVGTTAGETRTLDPGGFMGVANLLEPRLQAQDVTATQASTLSTFDRQDLDRLWRENPAGAAFFHLALTSRLIALLRTANERLVKLCELPLDQLDHEGLRRALRVVDDALDDQEGRAISD